MSARSSCRLVAVLLLPFLGACQTVSDIDAAMRRVDVLDRVFARREAVPPRTGEAAPVPAPAVVPPDPGPPKEADAPPDPEPVAVAAAAPEPEPPRPPVDPALRRAALLRQNPWMTSFWGELTPAQQGRVARRLQRPGQTLPAGDLAPAWDRMGLEDRVRLLFGDRA